MSEDIVLPRLRRDRFKRRRCGISRESARKALLGLDRAGAVRREGRGLGVRYVPATWTP